MAVILVTLALPQAQSAPPMDRSSYLKSRLGLMPLAYGPTAEEKVRLQQEKSLNSDCFSSFVVYPSGSWPEAVVAGEYTGDGRNDVVLSTSFDWDPANDNRVHLFAQTPSGTLNLVQRQVAGTNPIAISSGDLNRDLRLDVVTANHDADTAGVFTQQAGGQLNPMSALASGAGPDGVAVGDFNGDLRDDVAVSFAISQSVAIYYQQPGGTFSAPEFIGVSSGGFNDLAVGDTNSDGYDDLILLRGAGHHSSQVAIFLQQNRHLAAPIFRTAQDGGFLTHGLAVGDITGDGRDDVVVTAGGNVPNAYLNVFVQQSDGILATTPVVYAAYHLPQSVEIGDVNHDGRNDVITDHAAWMSLSVYTQTVAGALHAYERYPLPYSDFYRPTGLALADVTNDGALDVLIASHSSTPAENGLVVLVNTGDAPTSKIAVPVAGTYITNTAVYAIQGTASTSAGTLALSMDGGRTWHTQPSALNWSYNWTVPAQDGSYILLSRVTDAQSRVQSPPGRSRAIVDHTLPIGSLIIDGGAIYANQLTVTLVITASDFNDVGKMRFTNQEGGYSSWVPFTTTHSWTLPGADGVKTVTGQVRDLPGNASNPFSDTIVLDTTPPSCHILVNGDASYANSSQVTLTLTSTDTNGVAQLCVRNAGGGWTCQQPPVSTMNWNLGSGDGVHTVEARFRDMAGNDSPVCQDTIILDTVPPNCDILIASGDTYITNTMAVLTLTSTDLNGVEWMYLRDQGQAWSPGEVYTTTRTWPLPMPDGLKTVEAQFEDFAGNRSAVCEDSIILDTTPPNGWVLIEGGALYTPRVTVTLNLGASDVNGVSGMCIRNDSAPCSTWEAYTLTRSWILFPGDGVKTVYVWYRDTPDNIGGPFTDTIILDATPPGGAVVINDGANYTRFLAVTLTITATDQISVTDMCVSNSSTPCSTWEPYASTRSWELVPGDGGKSVYVWFRDAVGNISEPQADSIILDMTAPACQIFVNSGSTYVTQTAVILNIACSDANPPIQVCYSNDGNNWSDCGPYTAIKDWVLSGGDELKTVYITATDTPGNMGGPFTDTIILDTTAPSCTLLINDEDLYTIHLSIMLTPTCSDANGIYQIRLSDDGANWGSWQSPVPTLPWILPMGDGVKTVYLQARDTPLNVGGPFTDSIILDTILPSGGCSIPVDYVNNPTVRVELWASDANGVPWMSVRNASEPWPDWASFVTPIQWTVPGSDGEKIVECQFQDTPGNVSPVYSDSVILDTAPPTCEVAVNGGVEYVREILVTLNLTSTDTYGVDQMQFSNDTQAWSDWEAYARSRSWELLPGDGLKEVWGQFHDPAWNIQRCSDVVILDTVAPTSSVSPLPPVISTLAFTVTWSGVDAASGIAGYDIQVRDGQEGTWTDWLTDTLQTNSVFTATGGHTYYFRSRAADRAGNIEAWPVEPDWDTMTRIGSRLFLPLVVKATTFNGEDFDLGLLPITQTVIPGERITYTVDLMAVHGFTQSVFLDASGLPTGTTVVWGQNPVTPTMQTVMVVSTTSSTPLGSYIITVTGVGGSSNHMVRAGLTVALPPLQLPNLVVLTSTTEPLMAAVGQPFEVQVEVANIGEVDAPTDFSVDWYLDSSAPPTATVPGNASWIQPGLSTGSVVTLTALYTCTSAGTHTVYAQVNRTGAISESSVEDNLLGPLTLVVTASLQPDLMVNILNPVPLTLTAGQAATITLEVMNQGTLTTSSDIRLDLYVDPPAPPLPRETGVALTITFSLGPSDSIIINIPYTFMITGTHILYAQVDALQVISESNESNNLSGPFTVTVYARNVPPLLGEKPQRQVVRRGLPAQQMTSRAVHPEVNMPSFYLFSRRC